MSRPLSASILFIALVAGVSIGCEPARSTGRIRELDLPRGYVDTPVAGALPSGDILVAGWALCAGGIEDISIYADGRYLDSAVLGFARPDVATAEPAVPEAATSGFQLLLPAKKLPPGPVTLLVQARCRSGATRDLAVLPVVVPVP
jgi:hypothetical protein